VYEVPGHSAGHTVLFDEADGILLASDAVGSNRPTIPDSADGKNADRVSPVTHMCIRLSPSAVLVTS